MEQQAVVHSMVEFPALINATKHNTIHLKMSGLLGGHMLPLHL